MDIGILTLKPLSILALHIKDFDTFLITNFCIPFDPSHPIIKVGIFSILFSMHLFNNNKLL